MKTKKLLVKLREERGLNQQKLADWVPMIW